MQSQRLSDDEVRELLARAEEIQSKGSLNTYEAVMSAAEEAGLSRDAISQAVQERLSATFAPGEGQLVFAKGEKDRYFAAEVVKQGGGSALVRFLNGSEHQVPLSSLRPLTLLPGESIVCPWPDWGWWTCSVVHFDTVRRKVKVTDSLGTEKTFDLAQVFVKAPGTPPDLSKYPWLLMSALTLGGGIIGSILTWLAMR
jgi:hypothetical protein